MLLNIFTCYIYLSNTNLTIWRPKCIRSIRIIVIFVTVTVIHAKASWLRLGPYTAAMGRKPAMGPKYSHKKETSSGDNSPQNQNLKKALSYTLVMKYFFKWCGFKPILYSSCTAVRGYREERNGELGSRGVLKF